MLPPYCPLNATVLPSGEICGLDASPGKLVRRRASPPVRATIQMLPAYANAMWFALTVGVRSSRVLPAGSSPRAGRLPADAFRGAPCADAVKAMHALNRVETPRSERRVRMAGFGEYGLRFYHGTCVAEAPAQLPALGWSHTRVERRFLHPP